MLIRVKSNDDADELFENLQKYKMGAPTGKQPVEPEAEENSDNDEEDIDEEYVDDEDLDEQELDESYGPPSDDNDEDIQCLD